MKNELTVFPKGIDSRLYWSDLKCTQASVQDEYQKHLANGDYTEATKTLVASDVFYYGAWLINLFKNRLVAMNDYLPNIEKPHANSTSEIMQPTQTYANILIKDEDEGTYKEGNVWISTRDISATEWVTLTSAEYQALSSDEKHDSNIVYLISDQGD